MRLTPHLRRAYGYTPPNFPRVFNVRVNWCFVWSGVWGRTAGSEVCVGKRLSQNEQAAAYDSCFHDLRDDWSFQRVSTGDPQTGAGPLRNLG
jgi:hypothetical protein